MLGGCSPPKRVEPALVVKPELGPMTIAVAPALNLSGTTDFDPERFADLMASELSYFEGISVVPVSRVLSVLAAQGAEGVESPTHALELVRLLGADAILVFAVTEYGPYDPPSIGISGCFVAGGLSCDRGAVRVSNSATPRPDPAGLRCGARGRRRRRPGVRQGPQR